MKHTDNGIKDLFLSIFNNREQQKFMVTVNRRYAVVLKVDEDLTVHSDRRSPRGQLCIFDAEDASNTPLFKVRDSGVLGYHGNERHIAEQVKVLKEILVEAHSFFVLGI